MTHAATQPISRYPTPPLKDLPGDIRALIDAVQEKSGFVPNVFLMLARRPDEFRAFFAYHDALMDKPGNLTKAEREMIVVATSAANGCQYCVIAHGAILRVRAKDPLIADQVAVNYRKADITPRQRAMLDFAMTVAGRADDRRRGLRRAVRARLRYGGRLGHCRHRGDLRPVEPPRQRVQSAAERRVLFAGAVIAGEAALETVDQASQRCSKATFISASGTLLPARSGMAHRVLPRPPYGNANTISASPCG